MSGVLIGIGLSALSNAIADAFAATGAYQHNRRDPERVALSAVAARALSAAFADARRADLTASPEWISAVAAEWRPAFSPDVVARLMSVIATPSAANQHRFTEVIRTALTDVGFDLALLEQTLSVERFAEALPRHLWPELKRAAIAGAALRDLVQQLLSQRAEYRESAQDASEPREHRHDMLTYLRETLRDARGAVPAFLPDDRSANLHQRVRVRLKTRVAGRNADPDGDRAYQPPVEYAGLDEHAPAAERSWDEVRTCADRIVVLADPGLGKSWLVRTETIRLAMAALAALDEDHAAVIPVPIRADALAEGLRWSIGEAAARHFAARGRLAERSRAYFAEQVDAGTVHLLIDGLDELPDAATRQRLRAALSDWSRRPGVRRWLVTSRIAGYTGLDTRDTEEIELLGLTTGQVETYVRAWGLPEALRDRLLKAVADPAVSGMARIPLLLALLCSLAGADQDIPRTRVELYGRILRWFLQRPHRGADRSDRENQTLLDLVQEVATHFANRDAGWADLMPHDALTRVIRQSPRLGDLACTPDRLIEQLSVELGLIVPEGDTSRGRRARYLFAHRTFAEYLVACHLATLDEQDRWAIIERHLWFDPEWLQVISMLGGLLDDGGTRRLVERLCRVDDDVLRQGWLMAVRVVSEHPEADGVLTAESRRSLRRTLAAVVRHPYLRWSAVTALRGVPVLTPAAAAELLALTEADDPDVRHAAVQSVASVEDPSPVAHLLARLDDEDEHVAAEAAKSLAGRHSPGVLDALLARAGADRRRVALACTESLRALPEAVRIAAVRPLLAAGRPTAVRAAGCAVLRGAGPAAADLILAGLADEDIDVRAAAAQAVTGPLDPRVEAALLRRLEAYLTESAAGADLTVWTGDTGYRSDLDAQAARAALDRCASQAPGFTAAFLRQVVDRGDSVDRFGRDTGPTAPTADLVDELVLRLSDGGARAGRAARLLRAMRPDGIDDALLRLLDTGSPAVVAEVLTAARGRRDERLPHRAAELLAHPDETVRRAALELVIDADPPGLEDLLLRGLRDESLRIRHLAAGGCAGRHDDRLVSALLERVRDPDEGADVVGPAISALGDREEPGVREALLACLRGETGGEPRPRPMLYPGRAVDVTAAAVLAVAEPETVLSEMTARAGITDGYRGREVAGALRRCPAPGTVEFLVRMRREGARKTRIAAHNALLARPYPEDLVTLVDLLDGMPPEMRQDMVVVAAALAARHYRKLADADRRRVRGRLTAAVAAAAG
ncbi:signal transduction protein [Actinoplanes sp. SE50]|uniref:HEAT repeat domain-containing protein n=1 Tax=unclassified Actinoplanes TaxID=2626549 RepID=UPI00023ED0BE|nr:MULTISPECIES: HEAT repeat domain-containing protein [unclassified Actinoplanes]AEV85547.1 signal transduction protein [Actinoplanes sp. SE50/110]ATO83940.1 signal transduction protein [Actinoplanes sp. SE50]SLM01350.1 PBS lyase HEAT-like repeat domain protein [Actinoplanes sp. SE50/110]